MLIEKDHGRKFMVDLVEEATGVPPLDCRLEYPKFTFVRMPAGKYSVRVRATHPSALTIIVDGKTVAQAKVRRGEHHFGEDDGGTPLVFKPGMAVIRVEQPAREPASADDGPGTLDAAVAKLEAKSEDVRTNGRVIVHLRATDGDDHTANRDALPPDDVTVITFQMNAPADHDQLVASNLDRMVMPETEHTGHCNLCH